MGVGRSDERRANCTHFNHFRILTVTSIVHYVTCAIYLSPDTSSDWIIFLLSSRRSTTTRKEMGTVSLRGMKALITDHDDGGGLGISNHEYNLGILLGGATLEIARIHRHSSLVPAGNRNSSDNRAGYRVGRANMEILARMTLTGDFSFHPPVFAVIAMLSSSLLVLSSRVGGV